MPEHALPGPAAPGPQSMPIGTYEWRAILRRCAAIPLAVRCIAGLVADYAGTDGTHSFPGEHRLHIDSGLSISTVRRHLKTLRERYQLIERVSCGSDAGRRGLADEYRLVIPADLAARVVLTEDPALTRPPRPGPRRSTRNGPAPDPNEDQYPPVITGQSNADHRSTERGTPVTQMTAQDPYTSHSTTQEEPGLMWHPPKEEVPALPPRSTPDLELDYQNAYATLCTLPDFGARLIAEARTRCPAGTSPSELVVAAVTGHRTGCTLTAGASP